MLYQLSYFRIGQVPGFTPTFYNLIPLRFAGISMELVLLLTSKPHRRCTWWAGQDSNLRGPFGRQIYSLLRLTTPPPTQNLYHILESNQVILCVYTAICVSSPLNDSIPTIKAYYIGPSSVWCSVYSNRSIWRRSPRVSNQQGNPNWFYVFDQLSWTQGGFEPHPPLCQSGVLPGYTTRPIIKTESCKLPSAEVTDSNGPRTSVPGRLCIQY